MSSIYDFLNTEASNSTTGGVNAAEGMDPSAVNDASRQLKQLLAAFVDDLGAVNTVGGTGDAITVTLGLVGGANSISAYATGQIFRFIAGAANTGAATMNVNAIGAKAIRKISGGTDVALVAGDIAAGETYLVIYRATANAAAGAWVIIGGSAAAAASTSAAGIVELLTNTEAVTGTDTSRAATANNLSAVRARRNLFDDSALQLSTVNGTTSGTTNGYELGGGWKVFRVTSAGTITGAWVASTTPAGAPNRNRITISVADASLAAGEYLIATKAIPGRELAHLKYGTAGALQTNFRALVKMPAGTYSFAIQNPAANRSYVGEFTPASADTDEIITANIAGDQSGTWPVDTSLWTFNIVLAAGSTFQGTTGWQNGNILGTSAVTNGMGTVSSVFEFGELGWHADPQSTGVAPVWELPSYRDSSLYQSTITLGTAVASTSGTAITFTGIPSTAKRVTINYAGVSTSGTSDLLLRIGNGSVVTTGYAAGVGAIAAASAAGSTYTNGFGFSQSGGTAAATLLHGTTILTLENAATNTWVASGTYGHTGGGLITTLMGGSIALAGSLDRVSLTTAGGTDTFDAGSINITYE